MLFREVAFFHMNDNVCTSWPTTLHRAYHNPNSLQVKATLYWLSILLTLVCNSYIFLDNPAVQSNNFLFLNSPLMSNIKCIIVFFTFNGSWTLAMFLDSLQHTFSIGTVIMRFLPNGAYVTKEMFLPPLLRIR